jgi:hypothetical protein
MANTTIFDLQRSDLNGFLYADVGMDARGMPLSVMSVLARMGVDPWQEAARLARLPRSVAMEGLARLIATMPASLWPLDDATPIAARLVALLPRRDGVTAGRVKPREHWMLVLALAASAIVSLVVPLTMRTAPVAPAAPATSQPAAPIPGG